MTAPGAGRPPETDRVFPLRILWSAGQFSDAAAAQRQDAGRLFRWAAEHEVDIVAGSEGRTTIPVLSAAGSANGYRLSSDQKQDCWIAVDRTFGMIASSAFHKVIPAGRGPGRKVGHGPRGLFVCQVVPHVAEYGPLVTIAACHLLTRGSDPTGRFNVLVDREAADLFAVAAKGARLGFLAGDVNVDDQRHDAFELAPLVSCWDDLGQYPTTHPHPGGGGPTIDLIARYDADTRVTLRGARPLKDEALPLHSDHFAITATYGVTARRREAAGT